MDGRDLLYISFWIGALFCTMTVWMYWHYISAALYSFAITLTMFALDELFYHSSVTKVNKE